MAVTRHRGLGKPGDIVAITALTFPMTVGASTTSLSSAAESSRTDVAHSNPDPELMPIFLSLITPEV